MSITRQKRNILQAMNSWDAPMHLVDTVMIYFDMAVDEARQDGHRKCAQEIMMMVKKDIEAK